MKYVGLWLDHKSAMVVMRTQENEVTDKIVSGIGPFFKTKRASRVAPKKQEERRKHLLNRYYAKVGRKIKNADRVYLMGPGIAKKEFKKFLEKNGFAGDVSRLSTRDKMTAKQVAAQTRRFFKLSRALSRSQ